MKYILTLALIITFSTANASIIDAQTNYASKQYTVAFLQFSELAKLGHKKSQHNIAVMLSRGEGVNKNLVKAYAWAKLSSQGKVEGPLVRQIIKQLSPTQLSKAQSFFSEKLHHYSSDVLTEKYAPIYTPKKKLSATEIINKNTERGISLIEIYANYKGKYKPSTLVNDILKILSNKLPNEDLDKAEKLSLNYKKIYRNSSTLEISDIKLMSSKKIQHLKVVKANAPKYPRDAALKGIQGIVRMGFNVYPDGSARDIYIIDSFPKNIFEKVAIKALVHYKFEASHDRYQAATQSITFRLSQNGSILNSKQLKYIKQINRLAQKGDLKSQQMLTSILSVIDDSNQIVKEQQEVEWLYNLAQLGIAESQYQLAKKIYYGNHVEQDFQKGFNWLVKAAESGMADAQNLVYFWLLNSKLINTSGHPREYWLSQAIKNGSTNAQMEYAKQATVKDVSQEELVFALKQLESYGKILGKTPQFYQIKASILNKQGHYNNAKAQIKIAIKYAKKMGWDLSELQKQKEMILQNKKSKA